MNILKVLLKEQQQGCFLVTLDGPIDTYTHELLDQYITRIQNPATKSITLDMSKVNYISSMGVGSLFKIRKFTTQNNAKFMLVGLQPQVQKVLDTVQALPPGCVFGSVKELDDYLDSLQKPK
jgi:anti-anti-sigma factor